METLKEELVDLTWQRVFDYKLRREIVVFPSISYSLQSNEVLGLLVNPTKA